MLQRANAQYNAAQGPEGKSSRHQHPQVDLLLAPAEPNSRNPKDGSTEEDVLQINPK